MYVAVKGGETAILNSYELLARQRRGATGEAELSISQIQQQLKLAVDRVMTEGSLFDPELAALAIKQASGDLVEAIFLLRAYRATLPRLGTTVALDTARMQLDRRRLKTCLVDKFLAQRMTTRNACSISVCLYRITMRKNKIFIPTKRRNRRYAGLTVHRNPSLTARREWLTCSIMRA